MCRRALIVEDDAASASLMRVILNLEGIESTVHPKGIGVLNLVHKFKPDLIMLDVGLPDINGPEVCKLIFNQPENRNIKVIIWSAGDAEQLAAIVNTCGASGSLSKSLSPAQLKAELKQFLKVPHAAK